MTEMQFLQDVLDRKGLLSALRAFRKGDFSVRLPSDLLGIDGEIAQAFNDVAEMNEKVTDEFSRIRDEVGTSASGSPPRRDRGLIAWTR
jgi:hypothetical protein